MTFLNFLIYISTISFLAMIISQVIKIAKAPVHLRWELYPVPHEKGKSSYGGSRLEDFEWWKNRNQKKDYFNEFKVMGEEIFFLKAVWQNNKKLWLGSFPMHLGLYMLIGVMGLSLLVGIFKSLGLFDSGNTFSGVIATSINILAYSGSLIGLAGAFILLLLRMFDKNLSKYSSPSHYFNIVLLGAIYGSHFVWIMSSNNFTGEITGIYQSIFTANNLPSIGNAGLSSVLLTIFFLMYMPFTHMTHFCMKYFTYHKVKWEDEPNEPGSDIYKKLQKQLQYPVSWAAPHIGADGSKTWLVLASESKTEKKYEEC